MSICLTCLEPGALHPVNSTHSTLKLSLFEILTYCLTIKLELNETHPTAICANCLSTLTLIYAFKEKALESLVKLENAATQTPCVLIKAEPSDVDEDEFSIAHEELIIKEETVEVEPPPADGRPFRCKQCPKAFTKRAHLQSHASTTHRFACAECGRCYLRAAELRHHASATHANVRPFACAACGKAFAKAYALQVHERRHTGERPFECAVCQMAFAHKSTLLKHAKIHANERKYKCHLCPAAFTLDSTLRTHWERHKGLRGERARQKAKKHVCDVCSKGFISRKDLEGHMWKHTGVKAYECEVCNKRFTVEKTLLKHRCEKRKIAVSDSD